MSLSVCMIGKNESENLKRSFASAKTFADEIIYVDTGSADDSVNVAESFGAYVVTRAWRNDFSDARNLSLALANKTHVMWMDCDDYVDSENAEKIKVLSGSVANCAYVFNVKNIEICDNQLIPHKQFCQLRMFPNYRGVKFRGMIHELCGESINDARIPIDAVDVVVEHHGYKNIEKLDLKKRRNQRIHLIQNRLHGRADVPIIEFDISGGRNCFFSPFMIYVWNGWNIEAEIDVSDIYQSGFTGDLLQVLKFTAENHLK